MRAAHSFTLSVEVARAIVGEATNRGLRTDDVLAGCGLTAALLADVDARVPAQVLLRLWEDVPRMLGDDCFGLHLGERATGVLSFAGRIFAASATMGDGCRRLLSLQRLFNDVHRVEPVEGRGTFGLRVRTRHSPLPVPAHAIDFAFAWLVASARRATGRPLSPVTVRFEHGRRGDVAEYRRVLGPVEFDAACNEMTFAASVLDWPFAAHDPALLEILESHARLLFARLPEAPTFRARVRDAIVPLLPGGATIDRVARAMHVGRRSAQRYLQAEGTTFAAVLDEVRHRRAEAALAEQGVSIGALASALGFADQSAFHKAFVRWTGTTPGAFRRAARAACSRPLLTPPTTPAKTRSKTGVNRTLSGGITAVAMHARRSGG
ncbi:MAG TPA: AraC family transcriptional regulator [Polyangiaceae bacterium]|nr:AraC family transcriptional regulator [Polyangiaceae bacterium]